MRILIVSSLFPPKVIGGAEICAFDQAIWLKRAGHQVGVLTVATDPADEARDVIENDLRIWRLPLPRIYPIYHFPQSPAWQKPIWHLQDHLSPANRQAMAGALDEFQPDVVFIHYLQGIGYNALREIGRRDLPTVYFLHDVGLACMRMSMFRDGADCPQHCASCRVSARFKLAQVAQVPRIGFCSPSQANLDKLSRFFPVGSYPHAVILNTSYYPPPDVAPTPSPVTRFLYVGRLHEMKGVELLLRAAERIPDSLPFTLTVVGSGPQEAALRQRFEHLPWCRFTGLVSPQEVSNWMVRSDVICVPSLWAENSPGVAIQALGLGRPVIASNRGGLPELVSHDVNGLLLEAGSESAWQQALADVIRQPERRRVWSAQAMRSSSAFDQDQLGASVLRFAAQVMSSSKVMS